MGGMTLLTGITSQFGAFKTFIMKSLLYTESLHSNYWALT